ncbi:titin-like [Phlebotomus argentipes]|uniref:titin-like n=1 Tax=Phlebotomus argentipes TaxID=94469 RepID=UPI002893645C|nr:titin-like [Phlebotomus argentipes]
MVPKPVEEEQVPEEIPETTEEVPSEEAPGEEEKPKKKKVVKKVKKGEEIKEETEMVPKPVEEEQVPEEIPETTEEVPSEEAPGEEEKPKKKKVVKKVKKGEEIKEETEMVPKPVEEEEVPEEIPETTEEVPSEEAPGEEEKPKKKKVVKKVKKGEETKEETEMVPKPVEEEQVPEEIPETTEEVPFEEAPGEEEKPKKKKVVKKVKKGDEPKEETEMVPKPVEEEEVPEEIPETTEEVPSEEAPGEEEKPKKKKCRKEVKPTKVEIVEVSELPQKLKLRKPKPSDKPKSEEATFLKTKLKSKITRVEYPPEAIKLIVTDMNTIRDTGILSRNIEEAEKLPKKIKIKKFKPPKEIKDDLERPQLEKYEKYESSSDESPEKEGYKRPKKESKKEESDSKTLKMGKGKVKPKEEETPEEVKLKGIPGKEPKEEVEEEKKPKKEKPEEDKPKKKKSPHKTEIPSPLEFDFEPSEVPPYEPEKNESRRNRGNSRRTMSIQIPKAPKPDEEQPEIKLKPFKKPQPDTETDKDEPDRDMKLPKFEPSSPQINSPDTLEEKEEPVPYGDTMDTEQNDFPQRDTTHPKKDIPETKPTTAEKPSDIPLIPTDEKPQKGEELPETIEDLPSEEAPGEEEKPKKKKVVKKVKKGEEPKEETEMVPKPVEEEQVPEEIPETTEEVPFEEAPGEEEKPKQKKVAKKVKKGEEIKEETEMVPKPVEEEQVPEEIPETTEEVPFEEAPGEEEKPKKKKKVIKKLKKDDELDLIQKMIEMDIPKTELEKYEKFEDEEKPTKKPKIKEEYQAEKPKPEKIERKEVKPTNEIVNKEAPEEVKLKGIPGKEPKEEVEEEKKPKKEKPEEDKPKKKKSPHKTEIPSPLEFDFEPSEVPPYEPEVPEEETFTPEQPSEEKPKYKRKKKEEPQPETVEIPLEKGKPKKPEETPEDDVKFRIPKAPKPDEEQPEIKLKPFKKPQPETETDKDEPDRDMKLPKFEPSSPQISDDERDDVPKTKKTKRKKPDKNEEVPIVSLTSEETEILDTALEKIPIETVQTTVGDSPITEDKEVKQPTEEKTDEDDKTKKKKKVIKKPKKDDELDLIQRMIEMDIPKTELEKYEKFEDEEKPTKKPKIKEEYQAEKPKPEKIERKEVKPTKVEIVEVSELPQKLKLRKPKPIEKTSSDEISFPKTKLKSKITRVEYPPEAIKLIVTDMNTIRDTGILSRNIEEAEKLPKKTKIKKFKPPKEIKDDLERPQLEKYEKYESSSDESPEKEGYKRPKKESKEEEPDSKTLKMGKGKVKPKEEEAPEEVKLKGIPGKEPKEEVEEEKKPKKEKPEEDKPKKKKSPHKTEIPSPLEFDFEPSEVPPYEPEVPEEETFTPEQPSEEKPKYKRKKKEEPQPETVEIPLEKGKPKKPEETPEDDVKFRIPKAPKPDEEQSEIKLKPFIKPTVEDDEEVMAKVSLKKEPKPEPEEVAEAVKIKKKKPKKPTEDTEEVVLKIQKPEEVAEEVVIKKPTKEETEEVEVEFKLKEEPKPEPEEVAEAVKIKKKKPKKPTEDTEEVVLKIQKPEEVAEEVVIKKPTKEETEEVEVEFKLKEEPKPEPEEVAEAVKIKKKKPKKPTEDTEEVVLKIQKPEEVAEEVVIKKPTKEETEEVEVEFKLKEEPKPEPEEVAEAVKIKKKKRKTTEDTEEVVLKIQKPEEVAEEVVIKKPTKEETEEVEVEFKLKEEPKPEPEEVAEAVKIKKKKPKKPTEDTEEVVLKIQKPEEVAEEVVIKKPTKEETEEVEVEFKLKEEPKPEPEEVAEAVKIKKKKPKKPTEDTEEVVLKIQKPEDVSEDFVEDFVIKKPKKPSDETEEVVAEFSIRKEPLQEPEQVDEAVKIKKKKPKKTTEETEEGFLVVQLPEEHEEDQEESEEIIEDFVIVKKKPPKPIPIIEEHTSDYTVKKLKQVRKPSRPDIPEVTDVENVTFRPKRTTTKEDIEQEFNIQLDSYAEEEISMSGKVRLKKTKPFSYSEEAGEASIKLIQSYEDDGGPIIEEIIDDISEHEDTMFDIDEPEEFSDSIFLEDEPDSVSFKLKGKHVKQEYRIEDIEEDISLDIPYKKKERISYEEDSLTLKTKRRKPLHTFLEENASLQITKEFETEVLADEELLMYSICTYVAENEEALNLVEGEKVYVIEQQNADWWFVRKYLTEDRGWVPAQCLMDEVSYTHYVQKKLNEKIDKLPVFERPGPAEKTLAPKFIEKLQPQHAPDGYTVQFECKVEGLPRPQITWFRQTAIIKPSEDFQIYYDEDNVATLIIREVFPEDAGTFTCVAKNAAGFASNSTELVVETPLSDHGSDATGLSRKSMSRESSLADILEGIPPTFSRRPRAQYVDEGTNVLLECRLVAIPEPDIYWTYNGEEIQTKENVKIVTESDMHMYCSILSITNVKKKQEGTYEVVASNREGEAKLPIILKVKTGDKEPPQILEPLRNIIIREGESVILSTHIIGNPTPKITWFKNGEQIKGNKKTEKDIHTVSIISPTKEDSGEYVVKAVNSSGSVETSCILTVEEPESGNPEAPFFVERFEEQSVPQNGTIKLPARVLGNPVPEVLWLYNNSPLYPSDRVKQSYDGENIELLIKNADSERDSGNYKCIASNPIGKASHGARITVEVDDVVFTKKLRKHVVVEETHRLILECETSHTVLTKWYQNDKEITGMDHRIIVQEGHIHKLIIRNASMKDAGTYRCTVKNQVTKSSVEVLECKPEFIRKLEDVETKEKEVLVLEVEITSDTAEVIWYKDGERVQEADNKKFVKDGHVRKLLVRGISIHDEGEYSCTVGDQECTAEVNVIELPPELLKGLEDVTCVKGDKATFEIELTKGDALVKWFKNGKELQFNKHVQLTIDGKRQKLNIYDTELSDQAEYSCKVADNVSTARLTVEEPLVDFIIKLPDTTTVTKDTNATFTVELTKPDVETVWYKNDKKIKQSSKYTIEVEGTIRRLIVHDCTEEDEHSYSCSVLNRKTVSKLRVQEMPKPPSVTVNQKAYKVRKDESVTFTVKLAGTPKPTVEWYTSGKVVKKSPRVFKEFDEESASLTIKKVVESDEGDYTIRVTNPSGEVEATVHLTITRPPSRPGAPEPVSVANDSLTLYWKVPEDDGNCEIIEYILEYHEKKITEWTTIHQISETTYTVEKLTTNSEYTFRVSAVNEAGRSEPSPESPYIRVKAPTEKEAPIIQEPLNDVSIGRGKPLTLSCVIGGQPVPEISWFKNGKSIKTTKTSYENRIAKCYIEETTEKTTAKYTCKAVNEIGQAETSCNVKIEERPEIIIDDSDISIQRKVGTTWKVTANISGFPFPSVSWYKNDVKIETSTKYSITTVEKTTTILIENVERSDTAKYRIEASNSCGKSEVELTLSVIDKPSKPEGPIQVKDVRKDSLVIEWKPPEDDGGLDIVKYSIEKCDQEKGTWIKVADVKKGIDAYCIQRLALNAQYLFRVCAENPVGTSEPLESEPVTIKKIIEKPTPPRGPIAISSMEDTCCTIIWQASEYDGGSPIIEYIIEIKETNETTYKTVGSTYSECTTLLIENLVKGNVYDVRISARNEIGQSGYLESSQTFTAGQKLYPPSCPRNLRCIDVTSRSATIEWEAPESNGGTEITGYVVEKRIATSKKWTRVVTLECYNLQYTIENLKEKSEFIFRVYAENSIGLSEPAETENILLNPNATVPSPPTAPLEVRVVGPNLHAIEWGIPESDGGAPLKGYTIAIRDVKKTMWMEVGQVPAGTQKFQIRDLQDNHDYLIRIFARNEIGLSDPLESEEPYTVLPMSDVGDDEHHPEETRSGLTEPTGFSTENTSSWLREHNMDADIKSYARAKLLRKDEYFFKVWHYAKKLFK